MSCHSHMRYLARKGQMRWHQSIADYVTLVIERISRRRVVWADEAYALAERLAQRYSGAPTNTVNAVMRNVVCFVNGRLTFQLSAREIQPERAWEEGRQCIAIARMRCHCGRAAKRPRWYDCAATCVRCEALARRAHRLRNERRELVRLSNKLLKAAREARESRCAA